MSSAKRKRTANFSANEKMKFLHILQRKGQVIINKVNSTDARTNRQKEAAWKEITSDLNASGKVKVRRTIDHLKKLWQKMKTEVKKIQLNANNDTGGEKPKKIDDPVLELVAEITGSGSSEIEYVNCVYKEENAASGRSQPKTQNYMKRIWPTEVEVEAVPPESESDRLWPTEAEQIPDPKTQLERIRLSKESEETVPPNTQTPLQRLRPFKVAVVNVIPNKQTQTQNHLKRRWPTEDDSEGSMKDKLDGKFVNERLKCEKEKGALIELQKQHMAQEHALKIKHEDLKTQILEAVLKKIQDEKPVNSDLMKIVSNM